MTSAEAAALMERYQDQWPDWLQMPVLPRHAGAPEGVLPIRTSGYGLVKVALGVGWPGARLARVRPGLPEEENVRRIIAAAQKSYDQSRRQLDRARKRERKPMKRSELELGPGPERKTKLRPVNRKRKAERFEADFGGKHHAEWGTMRPCDACKWPALKSNPNQNHHEPSRGAGGKAADQVTLCLLCHTAVHAEGVLSFQERKGVNLRELAAKRYQEWLAQGGHELPSGLEEHGESR